MTGGGLSGRSLRVLVIVTALGICLCNIPTRSAKAQKASLSKAELKRELSRLFGSGTFRKYPLGVWVESLDRGTILYTRSPHQALCPASNLKILTSVAAVVRLGPDFRYATTLYHTGTIKGGTLEGDLIIHGVGDPSISGRFNEGKPLEVFEGWAGILGERGIAAVRGDVIGDDDWFGDVSIAEGWKESYRSSYFSAESSALSFNDNCVDVLVTPGARVGSSAKVVLCPPTAFMTVENSTKTDPNGRKNRILLDRAADGDSLRTSGTIPLNSGPYTGYVPVSNATLFTATVLSEVLIRSGIRVDGRPVDIDQPPHPNRAGGQRTVLAIHHSPPLRDLLPVINKRSQNFYANQVFLTIGRKDTGVGDWVHSATAIETFLSSIGLDPTGLRMADGCGLSPLNRVTAAQLAGVLKYMRHHRDGDTFLQSLSVAGMDGTLRKRLRGTIAEGRVFAKTGYIRGVRSLSGYARTLEGKTVAFCFLLNNAEPVSGKFRSAVDRALLNIVRLE